MDTSCHFTPTQVRRIIPKLRRNFCVLLSEHLSWHKGVSWWSGHPIVHWHDRRQRLNYARLDPHMEPDQARPDRPLIVRISVHHYAIEFCRGPHPAQEYPGPYTLEVYALPEQVLDFAAWIGSFADAHAMADKSLLAPVPHACRFSDGPSFWWRAVWTESAWRAVEELCSDRGSMA